MKIEILNENDIIGTLEDKDNEIVASGDTERLSNILSHYTFLDDPQKILKYMLHHLRSYIWAREVK